MKKKEERLELLKGYRYKYVSFIKAFIFIAGFGIILINCKDDNHSGNGNDELNININIPLELDIAEGGNITLPGKGFAEGDQIRFVSSSTDEQYLTSVSSVTGEAVTFSLPSGVNSGDYSVTVIRGTKSLELGSLYINIVADIAVADLSGMTVKGVVHCEGVGIPNVVVSDGFEVTTTDVNGIYYLPSQKKHGYVFVSVPGNYEVANNKNVPQFFKRLNQKKEITERRDFSLIKTNNTKHVVLGLADLHLANQNDDLSQFSDGFLPDINSVINDYQASGFKVYGLTLGDMTWERYWPETNFGLPEYLTYMNKIGCPVFNVMGNHDNNPFANTDWSAENLYRDIIGPTYYSFNLGDIHYIVLDDIEYINTGANPEQGVMGEMNYRQLIVPDQIEWLKKDLATIEDKNTPIVIAMHSPLYREPTLDSNGKQTNSYALSNQHLFLSCIQDFTNVEIISGHIHVNYSVRANESLMERNIAAVSGTWWWTGKRGYAGNQICRDGSPAGYSVWEMDGRNMEWYYKSIGYERDYQFRSYDLNSVHITAEKYAPNSTWHASKLEAYTGEYAFPNNRNEVLINVWGYDEQWKVEVKENNQALDVTRVAALDPLHLISYVAKRIDKNLSPGTTFATRDAAHMFKVTASSPTSTLEITVTDCFGNVYTESMTRPKELTYLMK